MFSEYCLSRLALASVDFFPRILYSLSTWRECEEWGQAHKENEPNKKWAHLEKMKQSPFEEYVELCSGRSESDLKQIIPYLQHWSWRPLGSLSQLLGSKVLQNALNTVAGGTSLSTSLTPEYLFSSCQVINCPRVDLHSNNMPCTVAHLLCIT